MARWMGLGSVLIFAFALPASAATCGLDESPGATLLLPYFEVDLASPGGRTTLFSINNASASAVLTNVTLWSDLGVPTLHFQVYLTGYDVQTLNLRDIFAGKLPRTASAGQDPADTISPRGERSQDINFASCLGTHPYPATIPQSFIDHLRAAHTGHASALLPGCSGQLLADGLARGYVTVDTVSRCELKFPSEAGYFGAGGIATNQNVLWGDFYLIDQDNNFAMGDNLVRLEADPTAFHNGDMTFYGRYVGYSGSDAREPLPLIWATRYLDGGTFSGGTELLVWRDSGTKNTSFPCLSHPSWYPLDMSDLVTFDEQETPDRIQPFPGLPPPGPIFPLIPAETNRMKIGAELPVPFQFGWAAFHLGLGFTNLSRSQAYVTTLMSANGRFMVGFGATPLLDACDPNDPQFPFLGF